MLEAIYRALDKVSIAKVGGQIVIESGSVLRSEEAVRGLTNLVKLYSLAVGVIKRIEAHYKQCFNESRVNGRCIAVLTDEVISIWNPVSRHFISREGHEVAQMLYSMAKAYRSRNDIRERLKVSIGDWITWNRLRSLVMGLGITREVEHSPNLELSRVLEAIELRYVESKLKELGAS